MCITAFCGSQTPKTRDLAPKANVLRCRQPSPYTTASRGGAGMSVAGVASMGEGVKHWSRLLQYYFAPFQWQRSNKYTHKRHTAFLGYFPANRNRYNSIQAQWLIQMIGGTEHMQRFNKIQICVLQVVQP